MFKIIPVEVDNADELLKNFIYDGVEEAMMRAVYEKNRDPIRDLLTHKYAWVGLDGGKVLGFGGLYEVNNKVLDAWVVMSKASYKHKKRILKFCATAIMSAFKHGYVRVQARVLCNLSSAVRFVEFLGFKQEGVLRKALFGNDCYMYSIIKEDLAG